MQRVQCYVRASDNEGRSKWQHCEQPFGKLMHCSWRHGITLMLVVCKAATPRSSAATSYSTTPSIISKNLHTFLTLLSCTDTTIVLIITFPPFKMVGCFIATNVRPMLTFLFQKCGSLRPDSMGLLVAVCLRTIIF